MSPVACVGPLLAPSPTPVHPSIHLVSLYLAPVVCPAPVSRVVALPLRAPRPWQPQPGGGWEHLWRDECSRRVCIRRDPYPVWEGQRASRRRPLHWVGRARRCVAGVSGTGNSMSRPRGKRAGAFLEMPWFPGRGLESGPAWRAQAVWEGSRGRGRGGCRGCAWPGHPCKSSCLQRCSGFWVLGWPVWGLEGG